MKLILSAAIILVIRALFLIWKIKTGKNKKPSYRRTTECRTIICIGSGGHTTEMLQLIKNIDFNKYTPRYYIMASSDTTSYNKVKAMEALKSGNNTSSEEHYVVKIPRSRMVHQSYYTSIFTTLYSILYCIPFLFWALPDLIICNGPGTCIPICGVAFILKVAFIKDVRIVFIESFCRTRSLSLTGKILMYFADNFLVQWPSLKEKYERVEYIGQLM